MTAFDLARFVAAQAAVHATAIDELRQGRKRSHWMWFVFPQLAGLGRSETARFYALSSPAEAEAYLRHPLLAARLREAMQAAMASGRSASAVFGPPDDAKFRSSMTLFEQVAEDPQPFAASLEAMCGGTRDPLTLRLLDQPQHI